ncbi:MAG: hypothetical protein IPP77_00780 [Bacteroidetes bacterium]|nr:hypothetical protein [Bacteroidota bacterium]
MKTATRSKITLLFTFIVFLRFLSAQDVPPPSSNTAPAYSNENKQAAEEEEIQQELDDRFRRNMNIVALNKFLGDLNVTDAKLIRKESFANIYSSSVQFDGAESYVERSMGSDFFVARFYKGTNRTEADRIYNEITQRAIRTKNDDNWNEEEVLSQYPNNRKMCFGDIKNDGFTSVKYQTFLQADRSGSYEVRLLYYFRDPTVFHTLTGGSDGSLFARQLLKMAESAPRDFEGIKGEAKKLSAGQEAFGGKIYTVLYPLDKAKSCEIDLSATNFSSQGCKCEMYNSSSYDQAETVTNDYLKKIISALDSSYIYAETKSDFLAGKHLIKEYTFAKKRKKTYEEKIPTLRLSFYHTDKGENKVIILAPKDCNQ